MIEVDHDHDADAAYRSRARLAPLVRDLDTWMLREAAQTLSQHAKREIVDGVLGLRSFARPLRAESTSNAEIQRIVKEAGSLWRCVLSATILCKRVAVHDACDALARERSQWVPRHIRLQLQREVSSWSGQSEHPSLDAIQHFVSQRLQQLPEVRALPRRSLAEFIGSEVLSDLRQDRDMFLDRKRALMVASMLQRLLYNSEFTSNHLTYHTVVTSTIPFLYMQMRRRLFPSSPHAACSMRQSYEQPNLVALLYRALYASTSSAEIRALNSRCDRLRELVQQPACRRLGLSPLHVCVSDQYALDLDDDTRLVLAVLLLHANRNLVTAVDVRGDTPLHVACAGRERKRVDRDTGVARRGRGARARMVAVLIAAGADVNARGYRSWTALAHACVAPADVEVIEALFRRGADANAADYRQQSVLHHAAASAQHELVPYLHNLGHVDLNSADVDGYTATHIAAEGGHVRVLQQLVHCGAGLQESNVNGQTPLELAALAGHEGAALLLFDALVKRAQQRDDDMHECLRRLLPQMTFVHELDLSNMKLEYLVPEVSQLPHLDRLDARGNHLYSSLWLPWWMLGGKCVMDRARVGKISVLLVMVMSLCLGLAHTGLYVSAWNEHTRLFPFNTFDSITIVFMTMLCAPVISILLQERLPYQPVRFPTSPAGQVLPFAIMFIEFMQLSALCISTRFGWDPRISAFFHVFLLEWPSPWTVVSLYFHVLLASSLVGSVRVIVELRPVFPHLVRLDTALASISSIVFIPSVRMLLIALQCSLPSDPGRPICTDEPSNIILVAIGMISLIVYYPLASLAPPLWQERQMHLQVLFTPTQLTAITQLKLVMCLSSVLVSQHASGLVSSCCLTLILISFNIFLLIHLRSHLPGSLVEYNAWRSLSLIAPVVPAVLSIWSVVSSSSSDVSRSSDLMLVTLSLWSVMLLLACMLHAYIAWLKEPLRKQCRNDQRGQLERREMKLLGFHPRKTSVVVVSDIDEETFSEGERVMVRRWMALKQFM